jgi:cytoskeletal protein CcmA (bactofilin family)
MGKLRDMWKLKDDERVEQIDTTEASIKQDNAVRVEPVEYKNAEQNHKTSASIGKSIVIKGELSGTENLTIEGQVEGRIDFKDNVLTIGSTAKIKAEIFAKTIIVNGEVKGNVHATERVQIHDNASVYGDIISPRVAIADGANFYGTIDMHGDKATTKPHATPTSVKPPSSSLEGYAAEMRKDG